VAKGAYLAAGGCREAIDMARRILIDCADVPKTTTLETEQVTASNAAEVYAKLGGQA
jgi:ribose transport system substrate-binding protein